MPAWDGIDATEAPYNLAAGDPLLAAANLAALIWAHGDASTDARGPRPVLIPAGHYYIELPTSGAAIELLVPVIGAGSSVTILEFVFPVPVPTASMAFKTTASSAITGAADARIEGLTLRGPESLELTLNESGTGPADCWAVWVVGLTRMTMLDVRTTRWNEAVRIGGNPAGATVGGDVAATASLDRCEIASQGTRIRVTSPPGAISDGSALTLRDCTIAQDDDGFASKGTTVYCGIVMDPTANLVMMGGTSKGGTKRQRAPFDVLTASDPLADGSPGQVAISDHYFGRSSVVGVHLSPRSAKVQIDNCVFAGESGIVLDGESTTYHISNCAFVGGRGTGLGGLAVYEGNGVADSPTGSEVEAWFSNCRFGAKESTATSADDTLAERLLDSLQQGPSRPQDQVEGPDLSDDVGRPNVASGIADQMSDDLLQGPGALLPEVSYEHVVRRYLGTGGKAWYFANCLFGGLRGSDGRLFLALGGTNLFHHCHFVDDRESDDAYPLQQHAGRIELHGCHKEGHAPIYLPADQSLALEIVLESCVVRQHSLRVVPTAGATIALRGSENELGDDVLLDAPLLFGLVTSDLQLKRGRGRRREPVRWTEGVRYKQYDIVRNGDSPERVYECTKVASAWAGVSHEGPSGTGNEIADGELTWTYLRDDADYEYKSSEGKTLEISWNADWIEVDEIGSPGIEHIRMRSGRVSTHLVGATIQLYAVQQFELAKPAFAFYDIGRILTSRTYRAGSVATLRYSSLEMGWILL